MKQIGFDLLAAARESELEREQAEFVEWENNVEVGEIGWLQYTLNLFKLALAFRVALSAVALKHLKRIGQVLHFILLKEVKIIDFVIVKRIHNQSEGSHYR